MGSILADRGDTRRSIRGDARRSGKTPEVRGFTPSSYGDGFADVYDEWYADSGVLGPVEPMVALVASVTPPGGRILELGVGTGRLALPLAAAGFSVTGIDASRRMLDRLAERDLDRTVEAVQGDMVDELPDGPFDSVLCAFNTLFNLASVQRQQACFDAVARTVVPGGAFVVEAAVPAASRTSADAADGTTATSTGVEVRSITVDRVVLSVHAHDPLTGVTDGQFIEFSEAGGVRLRPWEVRPSSVAELDEMATAAGFERVARFGDADRRPFDPESSRHVTIWTTLRSPSCHPGRGSTAPFPVIT
jgi:SAM-dependent methyltransferase